MKDSAEAFYSNSSLRQNHWARWDVEKLRQQQNGKKPEIKKKKKGWQENFGMNSRETIQRITESQMGRKATNDKATVKDIIAEKFPEQEHTGIQTQEAWRVPVIRDLNKKTPRHFLIRIRNTRDRDTIPKAARSKKFQNYIQRRIPKIYSRPIKSRSNKIKQGPEVNGGIQ